MLDRRTDEMTSRISGLEDLGPQSLTGSISHTLGSSRKHLKQGMV